MNWKIVATLIVGVGLLGACGASQTDANSPGATEAPSGMTREKQVEGAPAAASPAPTASGVMVPEKK
jgi:hypothetical protein